MLCKVLRLVRSLPLALTLCLVIVIRRLDTPIVLLVFACTFVLDLCKEGLVILRDHTNYVCEITPTINSCIVSCRRAR